MVRSDTTPVPRLDCSVKEMTSRRSVPRGWGGSGREAPKGREPHRGDRDRRDRLSDDHRGERRGDSVRSPDRDRGEAQCHGERLVGAPQVVATTEQERRRADVLGRLHQREERAHEDGHCEILGAEERVGDRGEEHERERSEHPAGELDLQRPDEEPAQLPPLLVDDVAKPELRQRLLDGEVEQRLEEPHRDERGREHAVIGETQDPGCDDRPGERTCDGGVDPRSRCRPAPEEPRGHRGVSVGRAPLGQIRGGPPL